MAAADRLADSDMVIRGAFRVVVCYCVIVVMTVMYVAKVGWQCRFGC